MFSEALGVKTGITALIGGGGKTSLMLALGRELGRRGRVVLATSTHIAPPEGLTVLLKADEAHVAEALKKQPLICVGERDGDKLREPTLTFSALAALADYVIVEADGSRGLPLKAHGPCEPVIPEASGEAILVLGLSGIGRPVSEVAHRPELYCLLSGAQPQDIVTPRLAAAVINREGLHSRVFLNQTDLPHGPAAARELMGYLDCPVAAGSLLRGEILCLY